MITQIRAIPIIVLLATLVGCASIDFEYPRTESSAFTDTNQTYLGRWMGGLDTSRSQGESGFYLMRDGIEALAIRLQLIQRAEKSIDLQYFILTTDIVGSALLHRLLEAADRGVRIRLLIDDLTASGYDSGMAGLISHRNFEIRVFNPFVRGFAGRSRSLLTNFQRVNRRMHNKTFIVDNQVAIIGGRNLADEYFNANEDARFVDLDVLAVGPVVPDASEMFDRYWNHQTALPVPAFAEMPDDPAAELERVRRKLAAARAGILGTRYAEAVRNESRDFNDTDTTVMSWAPYRLVYDMPDKGVKSKAAEAASIRTPLVESIESARNELIIVTPYFVPRKSGIDRFVALEKNGVNVSIVTNSLASQDQLLVHGGYAAARKPLLRAGVRLNELDPFADQPESVHANPDAQKMTLHTKAFVVDRQELFIGSFNFDPRSAYINTESGVIIQSETLASEFAEVVDSALDRRTFEVFLDDDGKLRWRGNAEGHERVYNKEPRTKAGRRLGAKMARVLPLRGQL